MENKPEKINHGGRNLALLGVGSIAIAIFATVISIWIYYETGDIYIDRSRPGFLPEKEEVAEETINDNGDFEFSETGEITEEVLDEYLENLQTEIDRLDAIEDTFGSDPLSNESLLIPEETSEPNPDAAS